MTEWIRYIVPSLWLPVAVEEKETCLICKDSNTLSEGIKCSNGHFICHDMFRVRVRNNYNDLFDMSSDTVQGFYNRKGSVKCALAEEEGVRCTAHYTTEQVESLKDKELYQMFLDGVSYVALKAQEENSAVAGLLEEMLSIKRQGMAGDGLEVTAEQRGRLKHVEKLVELVTLTFSLRRIFKGAKQCTKCGYGPLGKNHCDNLVHHHNKMVADRGSKAPVNNACLHCKDVPSSWSSLPCWDGRIHESYIDGVNAELPPGHFITRQEVDDATTMSDNEAMLVIMRRYSLSLQDFFQISFVTSVSKLLTTAPPQSNSNGEVSLTAAEDYISRNRVCPLATIPDNSYDLRLVKTYDITLADLQSKQFNWKLARLLTQRGVKDGNDVKELIRRHRLNANLIDYTRMIVAAVRSRLTREGLGLLGALLAAVVAIDYCILDLLLVRVTLGMLFPLQLVYIVLAFFAGMIWAVLSSVLSVLAAALLGPVWKVVLILVIMATEAVPRTVANASTGKSAASSSFPALLILHSLQYLTALALVRGVGVLSVSDMWWIALMVYSKACAADRKLTTGPICVEYSLLTHLVMMLVELVLPAEDWHFKVISIASVVLLLGLYGTSRR